MRLIIILVICFITLNSVKGQELKDSVKVVSYDNNITGTLSNYSNDDNNTGSSITFVGNNTFYRKRVDINSITNYSLGYSPDLVQNELSQRFNINVRRLNSFLFYQYNYSMVRFMVADNWIGLGSYYKGSWKVLKWSLSYAFIYQKTLYGGGLVADNFRNSFRTKLSIDLDSWGISTEYYYQPSIFNGGNYVILGNSKVWIKVSDKFNLVFQDVMNYWSSSNEPMINNMTIGIGYSTK